MDILGQGVWGASALAFAGGLVSFFSPCVAPLLPGYVGYLSGRNPEPVARADMSGAGVRWHQTAPMRASLLFVGGFSAAFVALGLLAAAFGRLFVAYRPVMETLVGIVMLAMGAFLLGLLPQGWSAALLRERRLHPRVGAFAGLGAAAPFGLGVVFAAGWTPSIGPVLAAILTHVGASADAGLAALLLAAYSLGFALPLLAIGAGWSVGARSGRVLRWAARRGRVLSLASGGALVLVGLLYVSGQVSVFASWAQRFAVPAFH